MKTKKFFLLALTLALVLAGSAPASANAAGAVVPFKAVYTTFPQIVGVTPEGCNIQKIPGIGKGTHMGESTLYSDAVACRPGGVLAQSGSLLFTADDGSTLVGNFAGTGAFYPGPTVEFWGDYQITGGTGRFEGVTGSGKYHGTASLLPGGQGSIEFVGTLIK